MNKKYIEYKAPFTGNIETFAEIAYQNNLIFSIEENSKGKYIYLYNPIDKSLKEKLKTYIDFNSILQKTIVFEDYIKNYYKTYKPINIGNFSIIPYFHKTKLTHNTIILDPGYCFGTGLHETTQLILMELSNINIKNKIILDIGTGSGILSIAAYKLNAKFTIGIDTDKCILYACYKNTLLNKCSNTFFINSDIYALKKQNIYDIVLINMLPENFKRFFHDIKYFINKNSKILLTGFLEKQKNEIADYISLYKYKIKGEKQLNNWYLFYLEYLQ